MGQVTFNSTLKQGEYLFWFMLESYRLKSMKILVPLGFLLLGLTFYHLPNLRLGEYFPVSITFSFGVVFTIGAPFLILWIGSKKYKAIPELFEPKQITIDSREIHVRGKSFENHIALSSIEKVTLHSKLYHVIGTHKTFLIPVRSLDDTDHEKFKQLFSKIIN